MSRQETLPSPRTPDCSCGNKEPTKFKRYFSHGHDGRTQLIGLLCSLCGQEWLVERFSLHPDTGEASFELGGVLLKKELKGDKSTACNNPLQANPSRTPISDLNHACDILKVGDHITWHRPYVILHHAIVCSVDAESRVKVIHWNSNWTSIQIHIVEEEVDLNAEWGSLYRIDYPEEVTKVFTSELVIARAKSRVNDTGFTLFDNCETFASFCKTGVAESCQLAWAIMKCTHGVIKVLGESIVKCSRKLILQTINIVAGETLEQFLLKYGNSVGAIAVIVFELIHYAIDIYKLYKKRQKGELTFKHFVEGTTTRTFEALCCAVLSIGLGILGQYFGGFLGSIAGGFLGSLVGNAIGSYFGPSIGLKVSSYIDTDDIAVHIEDLDRGDQVVFYGNLFHPRHHAIVIACDVTTRKVTLVHNTYKKGVVKEEVDYIEPVYRLMHNDQDCFSPDVVIARASSLLETNNTYSLLSNNCKHFARWCKLQKYADV